MWAMSRAKVRHAKGGRGKSFLCAEKGGPMKGPIKKDTKKELVEGNMQGNKIADRWCQTDRVSFTLHVVPIKDSTRTTGWNDRSTSFLFVRLLLPRPSLAADKNVFHRRLSDWLTASASCRTVPVSPSFLPTRYTEILHPLTGYYRESQLRVRVSFRLGSFQIWCPHRRGVFE